MEFAQLWLVTIAFAIAVARLRSAQKLSLLLWLMTMALTADPAHQGSGRRVAMGDRGHHQQQGRPAALVVISPQGLRAGLDGRG